MFGLEHALKAAKLFINEDDYADFLATAQSIATRRNVKVSSLQVGDSFELNHYFAGRESTACGEARVTKIEDGKVYFDLVGDNWDNCQFFDGMTMRKLAERLSPLSGRAIQRDISKAWRFVPYAADTSNDIAKGN